VIGIVASRLVESFGRPVALLAGEGGGRLRASVRAPRGFAVDQALTACAALLERHGGHPAAGGFTVRAENVSALQERLEDLARRWLEGAGDGLAVEPEALLRLERIDRDFWRHLQRLAPFGIGHPTPLFWSSRCRVVEQKLLRGGHLQLQLAQGEAQLRAIAWRWQGPSQWVGPVDVAYRLRRDEWQGVERLQLELEAIRCSGGDGVVLQRRDRSYWCRRQGDTLVIRNAAGEELRSAVDALADGADAPAETPHPYVQGLLREAAMALGMVSG
jgi:single-stranded-DNA-specific exonuclease